MANIHIRTTDGSEVATTMHFAVPATLNAASVSWQTIAAQVFGKTVLPDGDGTAGTIGAIEKAAIIAGSVVEQERTMKLGSSNPTGPQMDAAHTAQQSAWLADFQARFNRWGFTR